MRRPVAVRRRGESGRTDSRLDGFQQDCFEILGQACGIMVLADELTAAQSHLPSRRRGQSAKREHRFRQQLRVLRRDSNAGTAGGDWTVSRPGGVDNRPARRHGFIHDTDIGGRRERAPVYRRKEQKVSAQQHGPEFRHRQRLLEHDTLPARMSSLLKTVRRHRAMTVKSESDQIGVSRLLQLCRGIQHGIERIARPRGRETYRHKRGSVGRRSGWLTALKVDAVRKRENLGWICTPFSALVTQVGFRDKDAVRRAKNGPFQPVDVVSDPALQQ